MARTSSPKKSNKFNRNTSGSNQHRSKSILDAIPTLPERLQQYIDEGIRQKDIPLHVQRDFGETISFGSVKKLISKCNIRTVRKSGLSVVDKGAEILKITEDDPLGRWGARSIQEKLKMDGKHIPRLRTRPVLMHAILRQKSNNKYGIWSSGPNEEWCVDGHEKVLRPMGIAIWGVIDKFSRMELALFAVPDARNADLIPGLYLRVVQKVGGMPVMTTSDKGTEVRKAIPLVETLRSKYQPYITEDVIRSFVTTVSTTNITRERGWRPLYEKDLSNILHYYTLGMADAGYQHEDDFHIALARWVWAKIVQARLDRLIKENKKHRIRKQKKILLPSDERRIDLYTSPEQYGGRNQLIQIPEGDINRLLAEYDRPDLMQFGTNEEVALFQDLYASLDATVLPFVAKNGWEIFSSMIATYRARLDLD